MRLEPQMWEALSDIARWERMRVDQLVTRAVDTALPGQSNTSAVRSYILSYYRNLVSERLTLISRVPGPVR